MSNKITEGGCYVCNGSVVWCEDKNGKAYYACAHCKTRVFMGHVPSSELKKAIEGEKQHGVEPKHQDENTGNTAAAGTTATGSGDAGKSGGGFLGIF